MDIQLFTIGFTQKGAERFFTLLKGAGVRRVLDIRLNNVSQLAGFAKSGDLGFFLRELCGAEYRHLPECAPTKEMFKRFKSDKNWEAYQDSFIPLIRSRHIENVLTPELLDHGCLLCGEPTPEKCHRRLVAEYMQEKIEGLAVTHL